MFPTIVFRDGKDIVEHHRAETQQQDLRTFRTSMADSIRPFRGTSALAILVAEDKTFSFSTSRGIEV